MLEIFNQELTFGKIAIAELDNSFASFTLD